MQPLSARLRRIVATAQKTLELLMSEFAYSPGCHWLPPHAMLAFLSVFSSRDGMQTRRRNKLELNHNYVFSNFGLVIALAILIIKFQNYVVFRLRVRRARFSQRGFLL